MAHEGERVNIYLLKLTGEHVVGENPNLKDLCMNFTDFCKLNLRYSVLSCESS